MGKSFNKSGHSQTYHKSAGIHRRTTRVNAHFDTNKWITQQEDTRRKQHRYNNIQPTSRTRDSDTLDDDPFLDIDYAIPVWPRSEQIHFKYSYDEAGWTSSTSDFEDQTAKKGTKIFIALQGTAALGLAASGVLAGDFSKFSDGIQAGFEHLGDTVEDGSIKTGGGNLIRNIGWYQSHAHLPSALANIGTAHSTATNKAIETLSKTAFALDPRHQGEEYQEIAFLTERKKQVAEKKESIQEFAESSVGKEIIHARINAGFAGLGSLVHVPQALHGMHMMSSTGDLNGHLVGGAAAIVGYGLMATDQLIEAHRWHQQKDKVAPDFKITHEMSHNLVGYVARNEYIKDFAFKWLPSIHLSAKGGAYIWEASHMQSFADMATHASTLSTDTNVAAVTLLATGIIFSGSAAYEYIEQNGQKVSYLARKGTALTVDAAQNVAEGIKTEMRNELIRSYNHSANHNPLYRGHLDGPGPISEKFPVHQIDEIEEEVIRSMSPYRNGDFVDPDEYLDNKNNEHKISVTAVVSEDGELESVALKEHDEQNDQDQDDDDLDYAHIYIEPN